MLAFPSPTKGEFNPGWDKWYISQGVHHLTDDRKIERYGKGLDAYDVWIDALKDNKADGFGNTFTAQCYHETKNYACEFIKRIAERNEKVEAPLMKAADHYEEVVKHMKEIATIFPFPEVDKVKDEKNRKDAIEHLKAAKKAEKLAVEALQEALDMQWGTE